MLNIIITIDYEIFGNGAGDVRNHMIFPTEKMLQICDRHEVPITIMFEKIEYLKFIEYDTVLTTDLGYSPSEYIRNQLINAMRRGHDVQLHIHPQWIDAKYENRRWMIPNPHRSIDDLSHNEIKELIRNGKFELENLLKPNNPNYTCSAMRLTNMPWSQAPSEVISPMKRNGIKIHSLSASSNHMNNQKGYWQLDSENDVFEIPIHSVDMPILNMMFKFKRVRAALYRRRYTTKPNLKRRNKSDESKLRRFYRLFSGKYSFKWDACKQSTREMLGFLELGFQKYNYKDYEVPLVMISHSKDFFNEKHFEEFLRFVQTRYVSTAHAKFSTFQDFGKTNL